MSARPSPDAGPWTLPPVTALSPPAPSIPPEILILAHVSQFLAQASSRGGCERVGKSAHNGIAHLILASDAKHGETQVLVLHGHHAEDALSEGRDHFAKLQPSGDRGLTTCIMPDRRAPHLGLASLITCVPEQDALVASNDVKIIVADVHTDCKVRALLVDTHQSTETTTSTGAQGQEQSSNKLVLLAVLVTPDCPYKHVIDRFVRDPRKTVTIRNASGWEGGADCEFIGKTASHSSETSESGRAAGTSSRSPY